MYKVPKYNLVSKLFDALLHPIMWLLGGFTKDSIQRTHFWNIAKFPNEIEEGIGLQVAGKEKSVIRQNNWGVFHMPIFGGWKHYIILERADGSTEPWNIGWEYKKRVGSKESTQRKIMREVSVIPLEKQVKVLSGPGHKRVTFFGINLEGEQIKLKQVATGVNGDMKFKNTPFL